MATNEEMIDFEMALRMYFRFKTKEQEMLKEAMTFSEKAMNESSVMGMRYDRVTASNGCSVSYAGNAISYNTMKEIECDQKAESYRRAFESLNSLYSFEGKLKALTSEKRSLVLSVYKYNNSFSTVSKMSSNGISKQAVACKVKKIIKEMMEEKE